MAHILQKVDPDNLTAVIFDFNDSTGGNNPWGIQTFLLSDIDLGYPPLDATFFEPPDSDGGSISQKRLPLTRMNFRVRVSGTDADSLELGVAAMFEELLNGGTLRFQDDNLTDFRYIDFLTAESEGLLRGQQLTGSVYQRITSVDGIPLTIVRQPKLYGSGLDSLVNILLNPSLLIEGSTSGRPDDWAWDITTGISNESIDAATEAYKFDIATSAVRDLEQTTAVGTAASGEIWTLSFFAYASVGSTAQAQAVIRFLDSGGSPLGTEQVGTLTALPTSQPDRSDPSATLSVTTTAAPASTSRILATIRFDNSDAASNTVHLQLAQLEESSSVTLWVPGEMIVEADPEVLPRKNIVVYVHGGASTPCRVRTRRSSTNILDEVQIGIRENRDRLLDYVNADFYLQAEDGTESNDTSDQVSAGDSGGNISRTTFATVTSMAIRRSFTITDTKPISGPVSVRVRARQTTGTDDINLQLRLTGGVGGSNPALLPKIDLRADTLWHWADLGIISLRDDLSNVIISIQAERLSGSGNLDMDVVVFFPVDQLAIMGSGLGLNADEAVEFDSEDQAVHKYNSSLVKVFNSEPLAGVLPVLKPGLLVIHPQVADSAFEAELDLDAKVRVFYTPRWLV